MPNQGTFTTNTTVETDIEGGNPYVSLMAGGTFGGATIKLQAGFYNNTTPGALTWVDVEEAVLTAAGAISLAIKADLLRVSCTGGTAHSINWALR